MSNDKNLTIEEIFNIAVIKHSQNKILEVNSNYSHSINNLKINT